MALRPRRCCVFLGAKGAQWYGGNWLLYVKFGLFVVIGLLSIRPTRTFIRWRRAWLATGALPEPDAIRQTRKLIMWQAHILPLIPLAAVFLARGWEIKSNHFFVSRIPKSTHLTRNAPIHP